MDIKQIIDKFELKGEYVSYESINSGNINKTYLIYCTYNSTVRKYILQQINTHVFKKPVSLMENAVKISKWLNKKYSNQNFGYTTLEYIASFYGNYYYIDSENRFWRAYNYIDNSVCYENTNDLKVIREAGGLFGDFFTKLVDYDVNSLSITIPNFHNTENRINSLILSYENTAKSNSINCREEFEYLSNCKNKAIVYEKLKKENKLPIRATHNDTKLSNVLFRKDNQKAIAVIDLDTVMPGLIAYDFGDGARSICATKNENDLDLDNVDFDLSKYKVFTCGFLENARDNLTKVECETLHLAPYIVSSELASRFLKDYLDGNIYFKCEYPEQNLIRARNQIKLSLQIEKKLDSMKQITESFL